MKFNKQNLPKLGYAFAVFFYIDLILFCTGCVAADCYKKCVIKWEAEQILNTPDLSKINR